MRYHGRALGQILIEEGVLPRDFLVSDVRILIPVEGALKMRCDIYLTTEQLEGVQRAIGRLIAPEPVTP